MRRAAVVHMRSERPTLGGESLCGRFGIWCLGPRTRSTMTEDPREVTCILCVRLMTGDASVAGVA